MKPGLLPLPSSLLLHPSLLLLSTPIRPSRWCCPRSPRGCCRRASGSSSSDDTTQTQAGHRPCLSYTTFSIEHDFSRLGLGYESDVNAAGKIHTRKGSPTGSKRGPAMLRRYRGRGLKPNPRLRVSVWRPCCDAIKCASISRLPLTSLYECGVCCRCLAPRGAGVRHRDQHAGRASYTSIDI